MENTTLLLHLIPRPHRARKRNVTSAWRSVKYGNNCCQGGCSHIVQQQQHSTVQIMEETPIFHVAMHHVMRHAPCVDEGKIRLYPWSETTKEKGRQQN